MLSTGGNSLGHKETRTHLESCMNAIILTQRHTYNNTIAWTQLCQERVILITKQLLVHNNINTDILITAQLLGHNCLKTGQTYNNIVA